MSQGNLKLWESKESKDNYQAVQSDKNEWLHSFINGINGQPPKGMRLSHHENFCSEDRFWPKHYAARRGAAFPFYHQNALQDPDRQTSIKKEPFALCSWQRKWWSQNAKPLLSPGWRGLGWQSGYCSSKWTESILYLTPCLLWHFSGKIGLQSTRIQKMRSIFQRQRKRRNQKL